LKKFVGFHTTVGFAAAVAPATDDSGNPTDLIRTPVTAILEVALTPEVARNDREPENPPDWPKVLVRANAPDAFRVPVRPIFPEGENDFDGLAVGE
jgi:hypothetical protein